jgi:replicative DNA helicase Mcm
MNDWLNFLGWYVAEGHTGKHHDEISISHNTIDDNKERDIIKKSINELGYKCKKAIGMLRMYDVQLGDWLVKNCGHLARNKKVPDFIKNLDREQIKVFLKSLYQGDGHKSKTAHTLYTISKKLCDDVQELILKVGDASRFSVATPRKSFLKGREINSTYPCYCINWMKKSNYHNTQNKGMSPSSVEKLIDYSGKVYCITVPNNIIYVRRNGIPVWCGNSLRFYINGGDDHIDGMISFAEHLSYNICEECGSTDRVKQTKGWITSLCCKCFAKNKLAETRLLKNKQKELSNSNKV